MIAEWLNELYWYGRLAKWAADEPERKRREAEEKRQRLERKRAGPKHTFDDTDYMEQIKSTEEEMDGALKQGERKTHTYRERDGLYIHYVHTIML